MSGDLLGAPAPPPPGLWDAALDRAVSVSGDDPALALLVPDLWTEPDGPPEPDADDQHDQHDQHDDHDHHDHGTTAGPDGTDELDGTDGDHDHDDDGSEGEDPWPATW